METKFVKATELKNNLGLYLDEVETKVIVIRKHERDKAVLMSHSKYLELRRYADKYLAQDFEEMKNMGKRS